MGALLAAGMGRCIEVGPGRVLSGLMRQMDRTVETVSAAALLVTCVVSVAVWALNPFAAAIAAGRAVESPRTPTFVDGIGARTMLVEMWPPARRLLAGSLVVSLAEVAAAIRMLVERAAVVGEGAAGAAVAAGLKGLGGKERVVCVVSGGNIDPGVLSKILQGGTP